MTVTKQTRSILAAAASVENRQARCPPIVGAYRARHLVLSQQQIETDLGRVSGSPMMRLLAWRSVDYATVAKAVFASARMRSTMDRRPFERCGVRFSRRQIRSKSLSASVARMSCALLPE